MERIQDLPLDKEQPLSHDEEKILDAFFPEEETVSEEDDFFASGNKNWKLIAVATFAFLALGNNFTDKLSGKIIQNGILRLLFKALIFAVILVVATYFI